MTQTTSANIQHQSNPLKWEPEKSVANNNEFKNLINENLPGEKIQWRDEAVTLYGKLQYLKKKTNVWKTRLKTDKR